ncbi:MAG: UpxY family transcription antiterminator [Phocaeicola sp.]
MHKEKAKTGGLVDSRGANSVKFMTLFVYSHNFPFFCTKIIKAVSMEKKWYAAYVKNRHEKKIAERLTEIGIENFLPVQEEVKQWKDRKKKVTSVLIPMMIFVKATEEERLRTLQFDSILRYLSLRGERKPATIPEQEMNQFMFLLTNSVDTVEILEGLLAPGKAVQVIKGPLKGMKGELIECAGKAKIIVRLDLLGAAGVEMNTNMIEPLL